MQVVEKKIYKPIDHPNADPMPIAHVFGPTYSGVQHTQIDHHTPSVNPFRPVHFIESQLD